MKYIANLYKGRLNRRNFLIGFILPSLSYVIFALPMYILPDGSVRNIFFGTALISFYLLEVSLLTRRFHDFGWSSWSILLIFVPFLNIYVLFNLYFKKGDQFDNKYGKITNKKVKFPLDILNLPNE